MKSTQTEDTFTKTMKFLDRCGLDELAGLRRPPVPVDAEELKRQETVFADEAETRRRIGQ
jgi:hypothetical protein